MEEKRIVEIGGVKLEVDLRHAQVIESYRIGQKVKVLIKEYSNYVAYAGVIVGFDNFKERPCIIIAYAKVSYSNGDILLAYLTKDSQDIEICPMVDDDLKFTQAQALESFDRQIAHKQTEIEELRMKRSYFLERFGEYFKI